MRLLLALVTVWCCCVHGGIGESKITGSFCIVNGERRADGDDLGTSLDGCNFCTCDSRGFTCTMMLCNDHPANCEIDGQQFDPGETIPSNDCEKCYCINGKMACYNCYD